MYRTYLAADDVDAYQAEMQQILLEAGDSRKAQIALGLAMDILHRHKRDAKDRAGLDAILQVLSSVCENQIGTYEVRLRVTYHGPAISTGGTCFPFPSLQVTRNARNM